MFFVLAVLTYVEGASLHQERGGSTVFARYAFNELWSFVAGWAILLDYVILIAIAAFTATNYLARVLGAAGHGTVEARRRDRGHRRRRRRQRHGPHGRPAPAADQLSP